MRLGVEANEEGLSPDAGEGWWCCLVAAVPGVGDGVGLGGGGASGRGVARGAEAIPSSLLRICYVQKHDCISSSGFKIRRQSAHR